MPDGTWRVKSDHKNKHGENIWVLVHGVGILYRRSWDTAKGRTGEQARWQERGKKGDRRHVMRHTVHMRPATHSWLAAARKQEEKEEEEEEKEEEYVPPPAVVRDEMQPAQTTAHRPSIPGITVAVERLDRDDANDVPAIGKVERHRRGQHCGTPPQRPARWDVDDVADPGADAGAAFISSGGIAGGRNRKRFGSGVVVLPKMPDTTPLTAATAPLTTPPLQGPTQPGLTAL